MIKAYRVLSRALRVGVVLVGLQSGSGFAGPMDMGGQFAVNEMGAATYTIPIQVPPGTAGMVPKLALNYNSQGGNGLLGMGWSLSGLSAIGRCPRTLAQDNVRGSVNYDLNDRYCLDGQRLIAINGLDGAPGTEYRTELDSFSKIISFEAAGNGPKWFKVSTKSGLVLEFGNTADSRIEVNGKSSVRTWAVNKISDVKGNYIAFSYTEDAVNGDFYPTRIDYTGNATSGLAPSASVVFTYETRPDIRSHYFAGSLTKNNQLMVKVQTYSGTNPITEYSLTYDRSPATGRSTITRITRCTTNGQCQSPTQLTWLKHANVFTDEGPVISGAYSAWGIVSFYTPQQIRATDLNGDGRNDFVLGPSVTGGWGVLRSTGSSFVNDGSWISGVYANWRSESDRIRIMDVNGDGLSDIVLGPNSSGNWYVLRSTGTSFVDGGPWISGAYGSWAGATTRTRVMDVNGDGLSDIVLGPDSNGSWFVLRSTGTSFVNDGAWITGAYGNFAGSAALIRPIDANGDGKSDVVLGPDGNGKWYVLLSTGNSFVNSGAWISNVYASYGSNSYNIRVADVNGDGLSDILLGPSKTGVWSVLLSTGTAFVDDGAWFGNINSVYFPGTYGSMSDSPDRVRAMDVNGDGLSDVVLGPNSNGNWYTLRSTGSSFVDEGAWISGAYGGIWADRGLWIHELDTDGNGLSDIVLGPSNDGNGNWFRLSTNAPGDLMSGISSGLGTTINIAYKPLTDVSVYTKGTGATYPRLDLQTPLYAVSSVTTSNGIGGTLTTNYRYGGLKAELGTGRGMLGFNWSENTQAETNITNHTDYRQDWPYVGMPIQTETKLPGAGLSGVLSRKSLTYHCEDFDAVAGCQVAPGKRYFVSPDQEYEEGNDLNGAHLPWSITTTVYDCQTTPTNCFGNATGVHAWREDGYYKGTTNTYDNDTAKWLLGRLKRATVTSTSP